MKSFKKGRLTSMVMASRVKTVVISAIAALATAAALAVEEVSFRTELETPNGKATLVGYAPDLTVRAPAFLLLAEEDPAGFKEGTSGPSGCQWPVAALLSRGYAALAVDCSQLKGDYFVARTAAVRAAMDALAKVESVDASRVAVIGQRRLGEAAATAAAADRRIAYAFANNPKRSRPQKGDRRTSDVWSEETAFDFAGSGAKCVLGFEMSGARVRDFAASPAKFTRQGGTQLTGYDWLEYIAFLDNAGWRVDVATTAKPRTFRILAWNMEGQNVGAAELESLAEVVRDSKADVVLVVENYGVQQRLAAKLGAGWYAHGYSMSLAILSRWPIVRTDSPYMAPWNYLDASGPFNLGFAELSVEGQRVRCCPLWINWEPSESSVPVENATVADILRWELSAPRFSNRRVDEIDGILKALRVQIEDTDEVPLVIGGDFNGPSHLDWTEATKDLHGHGGLVVPWPVSVAMEKAGFCDTFRKLNPDPVRNYGASWRSPTRDDPRDFRIDFIYSKGPKLRPVASEIFHSAWHKPFSWHGKAYGSFPSDHGFVLTSFELDRPQTVQERIDACAAVGGGRVTLGPGVHDSGCLTLRSNVELHLEKGAVLRAPATMAGYPQRELRNGSAIDAPRRNSAAFIFAEGCTNVAITGEGRIDANGNGFVVPIPQAKRWWRFRRVPGRTPPRVIWLFRCRNVRIEGVELVNQPAGWGYWISGCDNVLVDGARICSSVYYPNNDGVHVNSSRDVIVRNCDIECGDDAIVMRANNVTHPDNGVCERMVVSNCTLRSYANAIRIGWINDGVIRHGLFKDIRIVRSWKGVGIVLPQPPAGSNDVGREPTRIEDLTFENITMEDVLANPIECTVSDNPKTLFDSITGITFRNVRGFGLGLPTLKAPLNKMPAPFRYENCSFEEVPPSAVDTSGEPWDRQDADGAVAVGIRRVAFAATRADGRPLLAGEFERLRVDYDGVRRTVTWQGHPELGADFTATAVLTRDGSDWRAGKLTFGGAKAGEARDVRWPLVSTPWLPTDRIVPAAGAGAPKVVLRAEKPDPDGRITDGYPSGTRYRTVGALTVDGKPCAVSPGEWTLDLKALYPDAVQRGKDGARWADVEFDVEAPAAGASEFFLNNDWYGEIFVNGTKLEDRGGPDDGYAPVGLKLKAGTNRIRVRTRAGCAGSWRIGVAVPVKGE